MKKILEKYFHLVVWIWYQLSLSKSPIMNIALWKRCKVFSIYSEMPIIFLTCFLLFIVVHLPLRLEVEERYLDSALFEWHTPLEFRYLNSQKISINNIIFILNVVLGLATFVQKYCQSREVYTYNTLQRLCWNVVFLLDRVLLLPFPPQILVNWKGLHMRIDKVIATFIFAFLSLWQ